MCRECRGLCTHGEVVGMAGIAVIRGSTLAPCRPRTLWCGARRGVAQEGISRLSRLISPAAPNHHHHNPFATATPLRQAGATSHARTVSCARTAPELTHHPPRVPACRPARRPPSSRRHRQRQLRDHRRPCLARAARKTPRLPQHA